MKWAFIILCFSIFAGLGGYLWGIKSASDKNQKYYARALRAGESGLVNPLLEYEVSQSVFGPGLKVFDEDIQSLVNKLQKDQNIDTVSVYFRSLNFGPWFGINESVNYFPASMLKVPLMIAYFKQAQDKPEILSEKITYDRSLAKLIGDFNDVEYYKPQKAIETDKTYTTGELIERMIIYSDNDAKNLLVLNMKDPQRLFRVYTDLGFASAPELKGTHNILTVHEYASFYRILYNVSYLNKEYSNKALELLAKTDFNRGISAGVPDNIHVAHKFGEHSDDKFKQLHDCGIIYYPKNPYILCIMSRGKSFEGLENTISTISKSVYEHVDKQTTEGQM